MTAYAIASVVYSFGQANGGSFRGEGFSVYLIPALVVGAFAVARGIKLRGELAEEEDGLL